MQKTTAFLMFTGDQFGNAEPAMKLYTSLFERSRIVNIERWQDGEPGGKPGLVKHAVFELDGTVYRASENDMEHPFGFTPSISLFVECTDEEEINRLYATLNSGGSVLMPLDDYGFAKAFAWVEDRYGVSWQLNLAK